MARLQTETLQRADTKNGHVTLSIGKEEFMFEVTEKAGEMIKESLKDKDPIPSIRVVYSEGG